MTPPLFLNKPYKYRVILGSASPRREQLLSGLDIPFTVQPVPDLNENDYPSGLSPYEIPEWLARAKSAVFPRDLEPDELLITADTLVFCGEGILGKPASAGEAYKMLSVLSDRPHQVITGVFLRTSDHVLSGETGIGFSDITTVWFALLSEQEINYYIEKYKPFDKAGAYGVQEWIGYAGIERIEGSYFNVMGLPVHKLWRYLSTL